MSRYKVLVPFHFSRFLPFFFVYHMLLQARRLSIYLYRVSIDLIAFGAMAFFSFLSFSLSRLRYLIFLFLFHFPFFHLDCLCLLSWKFIFAHFLRFIFKYFSISCDNRAFFTDFLFLFCSFIFLFLVPLFSSLSLNYPLSFYIPSTSPLIPLDLHGASEHQQQYSVTLAASLLYEFFDLPFSHSCRKKSNNFPL